MRGLALILAARLAVPAAAAAAAPAATPAPLSAVVDEALRTGADAFMDTRLSTALGLSVQSEATPVRQLTTHLGHTTHAFNLSASHRHELVMYTLDVDTQITRAYLVNIAGKLRKAVTATGTGAVATIPRAHASQAFAVERDYWTGVARSRPPAH